MPPTVAPTAKSTTAIPSGAGVDASNDKDSSSSDSDTMTIVIVIAIAVVVLAVVIAAGAVSIFRKDPSGTPDRAVVGFNNPMYSEQANNNDTERRLTAGNPRYMDVAPAPPAGHSGYMDVAGVAGFGSGYMDVAPARGNTTGYMDVSAAGEEDEEYV